jgi:ABC-type spermidine/putrescine transport system permease subunit II
MRRGWAGRLAGAIFVSAACVFLILPTLIVVPMSFTSADN